MSQLIMNNNYLSGIIDEANLDPAWISNGYGFAGDNPCLSIVLPHTGSLMTLAAAFQVVVGDTDLLTELMSGYQILGDTPKDPRVEVWWPNITAPDWGLVAS